MNACGSTKGLDMTPEKSNKFATFEILTIHQAAKRLKLAPRMLRAAVRRGDLPAYRPGLRTVYVMWPEVIAWLRTQRVPSSDHALDRATRQG
jgi:excisionase family DNA binding protein